MDWENSGWVDPAVEWGDLMTHPCYHAITTEQWAWVLRQAASFYRPDPNFELRARTYEAIILVR